MGVAALMAFPQSMIGVRDIAAAISGDERSQAPAGIVGRQFYKLGVQAQQGEADEAFWKSLNQVAGIVFHYPARRCSAPRSASPRSPTATRTTRWRRCSARRSSNSTSTTASSSRRPLGGALLGHLRRHDAGNDRTCCRAVHRHRGRCKFTVHVQMFERDRYPGAAGWHRASQRYIVTLNLDQEANPGGTVKIQSWANTTGAKFYLYSNAPYSQPTSLPAQSSWSPKTVEGALDRLAILTKQLVSSVNRAIIAPIGETLAPLPTASARAGKFLGFDGTGQFVALSGTGADSALRTDLASATGALLIAVVLGTVTRTLASVLGFNLPLVPEDFGAVGNGSTNDGVALQLWFDAGGDLKLPNRHYHSAQRLIARKSMWVRGSAYGFDNRIVGYANMPGSRISFAAGVGGLDIQPQWTGTDWASTTATQEGAYNCVLENFALVGAGGATATGLYCRTVCHLRGVPVIGFSGKGFDISASLAASLSSESGNSSQSTLEYCHAIANGSHGFHVHGTDANVVKFDTCNASSNGGVGYLDEAEFANLYLNCHEASSGSLSYKATSAVAGHTYVNCYTEGGSCDISAPQHVLGGNLAGTAMNTATNLHSGGPLPAIVNGDGYNTMSALHINWQTFNLSGGGFLRSSDEGMIAAGAGDGVVIQTRTNLSFYNVASALMLVLYGADKSAHFQGNLALDNNNTISINGSQVLKARQAAVADVAPVSNPPTQAEVNAIVTALNALLARLRASTGHGLIS
jgi:hypothetical protein